METARPGRKRKLADVIREGWTCRFGVRAGFSRSTRPLTTTNPADTIKAGLEGRIKDICATHVRYGYRRVHVLLRREGWAVNPKRIYRIYKGLDLQLRPA